MCDSVAVDCADGVDRAGRSGGVGGRDSLSVASDGGANLSLDVLRKGSNDGVSASGAVGWGDGGRGTAGRSLVSWGDGDIDCLGFPFNDFTASAAGHVCCASSRDKGGERESSRRSKGELHIFKRM
jgi:hypothetical protein